MHLIIQKTKKFQDPEDNKLIEVYQKLQIEKVSFTSAKEFNLSTASETTYQERELFDVGRSKEIDDEMKNLESSSSKKILEVRSSPNKKGKKTTLSTSERN